jgi:peptide chain release factor 1
MDKNELLPLSELKIETMRAHGAGGQHINTTDSAVRITHIPTGIQAAIQDERSQHKNKAKALKLITARVRDIKRIEQEQQLGQQRSQLMGGGDRSERIRTYNYPQDRITDHRCKVSLQNIASLLSCQKHSLEDGLVISFLPYLKMMRREELLQQLEE